MKQQKINHAAVWICVVLFQGLGVLWYSPALFANAWMGYLGKTFADFKGESFSGLGFSLAGAIAVNYFLAWLFVRLQVNSAVKGAGLAALMGIIFFALPTAMQDSFSLRPLGLTMINGGNIVVEFLVAGLMLGGWKKYTAEKTA